MATRHAPTFDLQSHSVHSDGSLTAHEVVARAARAGVELLALTDHDTVDGVQEALEAAATHGIRLLPAAELSAVHAAEEDLHILGYGIDHTNPRLAETLGDWRADRGRRIGTMADRLEGLGFALDRTALDERTHAGCWSPTCLALLALPMTVGGPRQARLEWAIWTIWTNPTEDPRRLARN